MCDVQQVFFWGRRVLVWKSKGQAEKHVQNIIQFQKQPERFFDDFGIHAFQ